MYSQTELEEAVAAGAISADAADALRKHVEGQRSTFVPDEEQFRLITGFNDIFVSIAAAILLFAVGWIGQSIGQATGLMITDRAGSVGPSLLAPLAVAATSWGLALYFTAKRRMALPSILLVLTFVFSVFFTVAAIEAQAVLAFAGDRAEVYFENNETVGRVMLGVLGAIAFAVSAGAAWLHWRRFRVPITIAAGASAASGIILAIVAASIGDSVTDMRSVMLGLSLLLGVGVFLFAMWWDGSDRGRVTRRSDVAFWLHLLAAPMIVHPVFSLLGLNDGSASIGEGLMVVLLYVAMGVVALAIDRRALLVSALAYVLFALQAMFQQFGAVELNVALTALIIGSALLSLSAFWHQARAAIVRPLPEGLRARLPMLDRAAPIPQPAA
jgi:hypothetical protein